MTRTHDRPNRAEVQPGREARETSGPPADELANPNGGCGSFSGSRFDMSKRQALCGFAGCPAPRKSAEDPLCSLHAAYSAASRAKQVALVARMRREGLPLPRGWE